MMLVVTLASAQQNWGKWKQGQNLNWQDKHFNWTAYYNIKQTWRSLSMSPRRPPPRPPKPSVHTSSGAVSRLVHHFTNVIYKFRNLPLYWDSCQPLMGSSCGHALSKLYFFIIVAVWAESKANKKS